MDELGDHLEDVTEEGIATEALSRLGDPKQVAEAAIASYRRRSFLGRHPTAAFVVFGVTPVISQLVLVYIAALVIKTLCMAILGSGGFCVRQPIELVAWSWVVSLMILGCTSLAVIFYCELTRRSGISAKWPFLSGIVLGVMAVFWQRALFRESGLDGGVGFDCITLPAQFLVPLALGWWSLRRKREQHHFYATAFLVFAVSPLISLVVLWSASLVLWPVYPTWIKENFQRGALLAWASAFNLLIVIIPSIVASLFYCNLARRWGLNKKWMLVSCTVLASFAAMYCFSVTAADAKGHYYLHAGGLGQFWSPIQLLHFIVPLVVGWWFMRHGRNHDQLQLAS
jgi:hypothetical protein